MAIRFTLADDQEAALAFGYSPLLETVLSLHVLVGPKHHALQHEWVRAMRGLRSALRREIAELSFLYRWTLPNCILPSATTAYEDFDDELARLRSLRVEVAAFELMRALYDHGSRPRRTLADADVRATVLTRAGALGAGTRRAAALAVRRSDRDRRALRPAARDVLGGGVRRRMATARVEARGERRHCRSRDRE